MSLALVDNHGRPLVFETLKPHSSQVESFVEESLDVLAARQHAKDSTKKDTNKQS